MALWHRLLVERPCGWGPGSEPGSVRYLPHVLSPFAQGPVLLYVGRFTAVKRLDLLITAYNRAREAFAVSAPLVLLGGFPGEIVTDGQTGWLVPPDDERALAAALVAAVNDAPERRRRGIAASAAVHTRYSWPMLGARLA